MAHPRIAIIDRVMSNLRTAEVLGAGVSNDRYYREWLMEIPVSAIPALNVLVESDAPGWEEGDEQRFHNIATGELYRTLRLDVGVVMQFDASSETTIDTLHNYTREIEAAILSDRNLGGAVFSVYLEATDFEYLIDREKPVAAASIGFSARYLDRPASDA